MSTSSNFLEPQTRKFLQSVQWGPQDEQGSFEFTLGLECLWINGKRFFGHSGGGMGHPSATYFHPEDELAVSAALSCRDGEALGALITTLVDAVTFFTKRTKAAADPFPERFAGRFKGSISLIEVLVTPDRIVQIDPLSWTPFATARQLEVVDEQTLRVEGKDFNVGGMLLRYHFDQANRAQAIDIGPHRLVRIP